MEENKNNAVEKAENIANANRKRRHKKRSKKYIDKNAPSAKERIREQRRRDKERQKAERERALAEKRVELARIKAHKKAEKEKAKAAAIRERNKRKAELKQRKMQLKAERQARKEMLRNESKADRNRRIALEKQARRDEKQAIRRAKAERKRQVLAAKQAKRQERNALKKERRGLGGWIAAVVSLGVATLVLASVLTFTFLMPTATDNMLEANYRKSFYDTVAQVDNIDLNISKILASKDGGAIQKYLVDTAINSELAENDLQQLPLQDESKFYTTKLINQIGDYAKYLNNKLISGESLTEADMAGLSQLYNANRTLKESLQNTVHNMASDYKFSAMIDGGAGDIVISDFNNLQNLSVQYPELIYDGPFSDGQTDREIKGLKGAEITDNQAREEFIKIFDGYKLENVSSVGEASGQILCYNVQGEIDGNVLYAQISKTGGKLIMFSYAGSCNEVRIDDQVAIEKATEFMSKAGIENMKPVWINLANNVYTINFASEVGGVIIYSDLVKVRVCAETEMIIGMEANSYYTNHTERVIGTPSLTEKQAMAKVSDNIEIDSVRLALVPIGTKSEKLCYEFSGEYDGSTYYVYIDAVSGRQVEMFKVIDGTEGQLLM